VYWYEAGGAAAVDAKHVKLLELAGRLRGDPASGIVAFRTHCDTDCDLAIDRLARFVQLAALPAARLVTEESKR
jgi:hypothetical protein